MYILIFDNKFPSWHHIFFVWNRFLSRRTQMGSRLKAMAALIVIFLFNLNCLRMYHAFSVLHSNYPQTNRLHLEFFRIHYRYVDLHIHASNFYKHNANIFNEQFAWCFLGESTNWKNRYKSCCCKQETARRIKRLVHDV